MPNRPESALARQRSLGLPHLIAVIYLTVSGGAYGIEDAVRAGGGRLVLALCLIVPLMLSLPAALMASELTALIPAEGGFYVWTKEAFGPFAGFAEAYFTLIYATVDMALYPVLFGAYLSFVLALPAEIHLYLDIALVWLAGLLNYLGARLTGDLSVILTGLLLIPLAAMVAIGFPGLMARPHLPPPSPYLSGFATALGASLTTVIWNFCGWENAAVLADELKLPKRNYIRAIRVVLPMVVLGYLLPLAVALGHEPDSARWTTGHLAEAGGRIGGPLLGQALALGGAISAFAAFDAGLLWISRLPFVLASDGFLPRGMSRVSSSTATPALAIFACCAVFTILVPLGFGPLIVIDIFFYMAALALELAALLRLRQMRPTRPPGLFVIPGGRAMLLFVVTAPMLVWAGTFGLVFDNGGGRTELAIAIGLMLGVIPAFQLCRGLFGGIPLSARGRIEDKEK